MNRPGKMATKGRVIALALTWDGARWPIGSLPPKARAFLTGKAKAFTNPPRSEMAREFAGNHVREIRICWVPRLKGGEDVLSEPFSTTGGKRIGFRTIRVIYFGDVIGMIYRRMAN